MLKHSVLVLCPRFQQTSRLSLILSISTSPLPQNNDKQEVDWATDKYGQMCINLGQLFKSWLTLTQG